VKRRNFAILLVAGLSLATLHAQNLKPLSFDDFIKVKRLADPQLSPSGEWIAYTVTVMDKEANKGQSAIWIVPVISGEPRLLASSPASDSTPRWSPDGKRIAFISSRGGTPQIWTVAPEGGEPVQLTNLSTGAAGVIWSPDGKYLAFASSVYPDAADDAANKAKSEAAEASKVKARLFNTLLVRHWNAWSDGTRSHVFVVPAAGGGPVDVTPGDFDTPPIALGGNQDYAFSPEGMEIAFVRNIDPAFKKGLGTNNDIFLVPVTGGEIKQVTTNKANDHSPVYSPDGRYLAYLAMARPGFEADKQSLMILDRTTGTTVNLTETLDRSVGGMIWTGDATALFFVCEEWGRTAVFRVTVDGRKVERVLEGHNLSGLSLTPDGKTLVFAKQALNHPTDVYTYDLAVKKMEQVTDVNKELLAGLDMNPAEEITFLGTNDEPIHGFLLKPPAFDASKKYPLVMLIHGGPQGAWTDEFHFRWNAQMFASPGYVVAMINFHGSTGYGQVFTDSITGDWGGKPYTDIMTGLGYLHGQYPFIDATRTAAAGGSYGGYMVDWIEGRPEKIFNCLVAHSGVFDLRSMYGATEELWFPEWEYEGTPWTSPEQYTKWSPSSFVQNFKTPCLVIHGAKDFRVPLEQGLQMYTSLQRMNVPSKFLYFPEEDHFILKPQDSELWYKTVWEWFAEYLK
jgi:dipeptidyl aminopeptidase/acylaminoacyl peptidase